MVLYFERVSMSLLTPITMNNLTCLQYNTQRQHSLTSFPSLTSVRNCLVFLAPFCGHSLAHAQEVLAPGAAYSTTPRAMQSYEAGRAGFIPSVETSATGMREDGPFKWAFFDLRPHATYRFSYGDGIQSSPGNQHKIVINEIAPGFLLDIGSHWTLDYTPTLRFYSSKAFKDSTDHAVTLTGGAVYGDWVLGGSQSYSTSSTPLAETAAQTDQESFNTGLNASRRFGSKVSADFSLSQAISSAQSYTSSKQWSTMDWLNYQVWPRLTLGIGAGYGYVSMDVGTDSMYEQYQGRINWRITDKISVGISGGLEDRQFQTGGAGDLLNPTYSASITYAPFEVTQLSLSANKAVSTSLFQNQVTENTSIQVGLNQRLFKRLNLNLGVGYGNTKYVASTAAAFTAVRQGQDDSLSYDARLGCPIRKRATASVFYHHSENSSGQPGYAYTSEQVGFELGYRF